MSVFMIISFRPLFLTLFFPSFLFCRPLKLSDGVVERCMLGSSTSIFAEFQQGLGVPVMWMHISRVRLVGILLQAVLVQRWCQSFRECSP